MSAEEYLRVLEQPLQLRHIKRTVPTYRISQSTAKAGKKKGKKAKNTEEVNSQEKSWRQGQKKGRKLYISLLERGEQKERC